MPTLDKTFGLIFDAVVISAALYGAGCLQAWLYFHIYRKRDPWWITTLVAFVVLCDTCQMTILTSSAYTYLVTNFNHPEVIDTLLNTMIIEIFFSSFIAIGVQLFYCYRVYRLSNRSWVACSFLAFMSLATFGILFAYSVMALKIRTWDELTTLDNLCFAYEVCAAVTNTSISLVLIYYLYTSKTGYEKTDTMINRLIMFVFNTGIPTSLCAVAACISIKAWPNTFLYIFWFLLQGRFYTNTLLVTLNTRDYIRFGGSCPATPDIQLSNGTLNFQQNQSDTIAIRIETSTQQEFDDLKRVSRDLGRGVK
ncbi:hypothetical protein C8J57DRAFT_1274972 [Mycena rebaudengoi]|nr:hypothetical protein C8J57DRAFT_1274972 [Mycena rebaudengoi]